MTSKGDIHKVDAARGTAAIKVDGHGGEGVGGRRANILGAAAAVNGYGTLGKDRIIR